MNRPGRHNPVWKSWRRVGAGKYPDLFFLEHEKAVLGALGQGIKAKEYLLSESLYAEKPEFWRALRVQHSETLWYLVPDEQLSRVVSVPNCSGFVGLFEARQWSVISLFEQPFLFVAWRLSDPGNVGTLLRTCAALTGGGVLLVDGCQPWSSKVARASAGALLRSPIVRIREDEFVSFREEAERQGFEIHRAVARGGKSPFEVFGTGKDIVLLGSESRGLPDSELWRGTAWTVPMTEREESLNIAAAAAVFAAFWASSHGVPGNSKSV